MPHWASILKLWTEFKRFKHTEFKQFKHRAHFHRMRVGQPFAQRKDELVYPAQLWSKDIVELVESISTRDGLEEDGSKNICSLNIYRHLSL